MNGNTRSTPRGTETEDPLKRIRFLRKANRDGGCNFDKSWKAGNVADEGIRP